ENEKRVGDKPGGLSLDSGNLSPIGFRSILPKPPDHHRAGKRLDEAVESEAQEDRTSGHHGCGDGDNSFEEAVTNQEERKTQRLFPRGCRRRYRSPIKTGRQMGEQAQVLLQGLIPPVFASMRIPVSRNQEFLDGNWAPSAPLRSSAKPSRASP